MNLDFFQSLLEFNEKSPLNFTQFYFWGFFALILAALSLIGNRVIMRNAFLFAASLFFYWKTSGTFVGLLLFVTITSYFIGLAIPATQSERKKSWLVGIGVGINLLTLVYFKYAYFFTDAYNQMFHSQYEVINYLGKWGNGFFNTSYFTVDKIILPAGVSFFIFHTISYLVDVKKQSVAPLKNFWEYGFYVAFFPALVAGPIIRAAQFIPQIKEEFKLSKFEFGIAIFWILNGIVKKFILSDYLAVNFIDNVFDYPENYTGFGVFWALMLYSLQVYADFSGYTDIAIGVSLLMGFRIPQNFKSPYKALNVGEFWKRWHISLSTWLRDYLYIPLGGNKKSSVGTYLWSIFILLFVILLTNNWILASIITLASIAFVAILVAIFPQLRNWITTNINMLITMILGGLWHGASWNFVIWGALNGFALVVYKIWKKISPYESMNNWVVRSWKITITFVFISFTRLFFRAGDVKNTNAGMDTVQRMWNQLVTNWDWSAAQIIMQTKWLVFVFFGIGMIIHWISEDTKIQYRKWFANLPLVAQGSIVVAVIFIVYQFINFENQTFIYFQF